MPADIVAAISIFAIALIVGLGPAAFLLPREFSLTGRLSLAPAVGFAVFGFLALPLFRYVGPSELWALSAVGLLSLLSVALMAMARLAPLGRKDVAAALVVLAAMGYVATLLFAQSSRGGIDYTVYVQNPGDAFSSMSAAEASKHLYWNEFLPAGDFANTEAMTKVADEVPAALFQARFVRNLSARIGQRITHGMFSSVLGIEILYSLYAFSIAYFLALVPLVTVLARQFGASRYLALGAGIVSGVGYWSQIMRDHDSTSNLCGTVMATGMILSILLMAHRSLRESSGLILLTALFACGMVGYYPEILTAMVPPIAVFLILMLPSRWAVQINTSLAGVFSLAALAVTGQLFYHLRFLTSQIAGVEALTYHWPSYFLHHMDGTWPPGIANTVAALWGLPAIVFDESISPLLGTGFMAEAGKLVALVIGAAMTVLFLARLAMPFRTKVDPAGRFLVAICLCCSALIAYNLIRLGDGRSASKVMLYVFPIFIAAGAGLTSVFDGGARSIAARPWLRAGAHVVVWLWITSQVIMGFAWPALAERNYLLSTGYGNTSVNKKPYVYDLSSMLDALDLETRTTPGPLMINLGGQVRDDWPFPFYVMMAFSRFHAYHQDGIIFDNDIRTLKIQTRPQTVRYILLGVDRDYLAEASADERTLIAATPQLRLYRMVSDVSTEQMDAAWAAYQAASGGQAAWHR